MKGKRILSLMLIMAMLSSMILLGASCSNELDDTKYAIISENNLTDDGLVYSIYENNTVVITGRQVDYDQLLSAAFESTTEENRVQKLAAAAGLIAEDCPVIPVVFNQSISVVGKGLSGVKVDYFGNVSFTKAKLASYKDYLVYDDQKENK